MKKTLRMLMCIINEIKSNINQIKHIWIYEK